MRRGAIYVAALCAALAGPLGAGEVEIVQAEFEQGSSGWTAHVTVRHADTGWDHYADAWRVVDGNGAVLGKRVLYHPHVDEQPFRRSLSGIAIPDDVTTVFVEARDNVHGWSPRRLEVDLSRSRGHRYTVRRRD